MTDLDLVRDALRAEADEGVITPDEASAIGRAFVPHGDVVEVRRDWLADDELEALDRMCERNERRAG